MHEEEIGNYVFEKLNKLGFKTSKDKIGNVIGFLDGIGETLLLESHLDRVPPGKANVPIIDKGVIKTDGSSNLGADDAAGVAIILDAVSEIIKNKITHPPLLIVFTVQEEIGLRGARALDLSQYNIKYGIAYDNAGLTETIITKASSYIGFDVEIIGKNVHPGKNLKQSINVFRIISEIDWQIGESKDKKTRINLGKIDIGVARNVTPGIGKINGEIRSFLNEKELKKLIKKLKNNISKICKKYKAKFKFTTDRHAFSYSVNKNEILFKKYKRICKNRFKTGSTFIASDTSVFRGEKKLKVFTISTGVENEHTVNESIKIKDLTLLEKDLVSLIKSLN